jgi:hypothetical protein
MLKLFRGLKRFQMMLILVMKWLKSSIQQPANALILFQYADSIPIASWRFLVDVIF